jgi:hypothetical protein
MYSVDAQSFISFSLLDKKVLLGIFLGVAVVVTLYLSSTQPTTSLNREHARGCTYSGRLVLMWNFSITSTGIHGAVVFFMQYWRKGGPRRRVHEMSFFQEEGHTTTRFRRSQARFWFSIIRKGAAPSHVTHQ